MHSRSSAGRSTGRGTSRMYSRADILRMNPLARHFLRAAGVPGFEEETEPAAPDVWHPESKEDGSMELVAGSGDTKATFETYVSHTGITMETAEYDNLLAEIDTYQQNNGSLAGLRLNSDAFQNIPGQMLMKMYADSPGQKVVKESGGGCSPTSFKRCDYAVEEVYGEDKLGEVGGMYYRVWNKWSQKSIEAKGGYGIPWDGAVAALVHAGLGYEVSVEDVWNGKLLPGAILNLKAGGGGHSAIFKSYKYDEADNITGLYYWQQYTGYNQESFSDEVIKDSPDTYQVRKAANWY